MTITTVHNIHPSADRILIFHQPVASFPAGRSEKPWPNAMPNYQTEASKSNEAAVKTREQATPSGQSSLVQARSQSFPLRIGVCSALLIATSSCFKECFSEDGDTTDLESGYKGIIEYGIWDSESWLQLMNILHNKARAVPRKIELEMFAEIAVLVDHFGCHEAVELWADTWIAASDVAVVKPYYSKELLFQLVISCVFRKSEIFHEVTRVAVCTSRGPIHTMGLPIPQRIIDDIERVRSDSIRFVIQAIERILKDINRDGEEKYGRSCMYMQLGYMDKTLSQIGLKPLPTEPYVGYSLEALKLAVDSFDTSVGCGCWSGNHLLGLKRELQKYLDAAFGYLEHPVVAL